MATIINADTTTGGAIITGDASGTLELQAAGVTKLTVNSSGVTLATPLPVASGGTGSTSAAFVSLTSNVTGTLPVANGGTGATTLAANNVLLGNNGSAVQVVAPGTAGNVLTSTGSTWASTAPSAGGTITATATGSVSAGAPVLINTDGTVSAATTTLGPSSLATLSPAVSATNANSSLVYCADVNVYAFFYQNASAYPAGRIGTPASDGSISWSSEFVLTSTNANGTLSAIYLENLGGCVVSFSAFSGFSTCYLMYVGVSASSLTPGTSISAFTSNQYNFLAWDPTNKVGMICGSNSSTGTGTVVAFTLSGSSLSSGATVAIDSGASIYQMNIEYDKSSGYFLLCFRNSGTKVQPFTATTGRVITAYTSQLLYSYVGTTQQYGITYVPGPNKVLIATTDGTNIILFYVQMTGSTPSAVGTTNTSVTCYAEFSLGVDSISGAVAVLYRTSGTAIPTARVFAINGTTISIGATALTIVGSSLTTTTTGKLPFNTNIGRMGVWYGTSTPLYATSFIAASSTITANNFIGFSNASYTNGQTATVTIVGGKSTNVTGVSVGVRNYVGGTSLTTTNTGIYAGVGLSSTSLLVKG